MVLVANPSGRLVSSFIFSLACTKATANKPRATATAPMGFIEEEKRAISAVYPAARSRNNLLATINTSTSRKPMKAAVIPFTTFSRFPLIAVNAIRELVISATPLTKLTVILAKDAPSS